MQYKKIPFEQLEPLQKVFMSTMVKDELDTFVFLWSATPVLSKFGRGYTTIKFYNVKDDVIWSGVYETTNTFKVAT